MPANKWGQLNCCKAEKGPADWLQLKPNAGAPCSML